MIEVKGKSKISPEQGFKRSSSASKSGKKRQKKLDGDMPKDVSGFEVRRGSRGRDVPDASQDNRVALRSAPDSQVLPVEVESEKQDLAMAELKSKLALAQDAINNLTKDNQALSAAISATTLQMNEIRDGLEADKRLLEQELNIRFEEIATLTRSHVELENERDAFKTITFRLLGKILGLPEFSFLPKAFVLKCKMLLIAKAGVFDADWYIDNNLDVRNAGVNPLLHFVLHGFDERRRPSAQFPKSWISKS